jgi:MerR family transcriptional regulator, light-induced transcriptional regulator
MPSPPYGNAVPAECEATRSRGASLGRSLELELIPRLLEAAQSKEEVADDPMATPAMSIGPADVDAFVKACLSQDEAQSSAHIDRLIDAGATLERICLDLLTPAARTLGVMWEEDTADFLEVTLGLGRMQRAVRDLGRRIGVHTPMSADAGQAFLCGMPDEQHSLGLAMVAEFFVADGWGVTVGPPLGIDDVEHEVSAHWYDVVGLSAALKERLPRIAEVIRKIRHASLNAEVAVLVGGQAFLDNPELVGRVGADASAPDAAQGPMVARTLVQARRASHDARPNRTPSP